MEVFGLISRQVNSKIFCHVFSHEILMNLRKCRQGFFFWLFVDSPLVDYQDD